jgi:hypothetical protein
MAYDFVIESAAELESLQWIAERYQYATELERAILHAKVDPEWSIDSDRYPVTFDIRESDAWNVQNAVEQEDGFLTCMGGRLKDEVLKLLDRIV